MTCSYGPYTSISETMNLVYTSLVHMLELLITSKLLR
jgi:hypothetical protein